jgi:hypothetical protein
MVKLNAYGNKHGDGPTGIGGQDYDITKMPKAQRDGHSFKYNTIDDIMDRLSGETNHLVPDQMAGGIS